MNFHPRHKLIFGAAVALFLLHTFVAAFAKPSFALIIWGDSLSCAFLLLALFAVWQNLSCSSGVLQLFWKVSGSGMLLMFFSQTFWFYYDFLRRYSAPSPVSGDSLFLLSNVSFLSAL